MSDKVYTPSVEFKRALLNTFYNIRYDLFEDAGPEDAAELVVDADRLEMFNGSLKGTEELKAFRAQPYETQYKQALELIKKAW